MLRIRLTSVMVEDQDRARRFYTEVLGFAIKQDQPLGEFSWLTVTTADEPEGVELLLEPMGGLVEAAGYQKAMHQAGIPATAFGVDDIDAEHARLTELGVSLIGPVSRPQQGPATLVLDDTCGNLIQLFQI